MLHRLKQVPHVITRDGLMYSAKRAVAYLIARTPLATRISFQYIDGTRLRFTQSLLTYQLFANKNTRGTDVKIIKKYTPAGGTVIDVGANMGSLTIAAAVYVGEKGKVLSFEPSPKFANITTQNVSLNQFSDRVSVHPVALGADTGTVYLNESSADDTTNYIATGGTKVKQATLDSFTAELSSIDFLKIDVEGYELEVLKGATVTLDKTKVLYIEFIPTQLERAGAKPEDVLRILREHFALFTLNSDFGVSPFVYDINVSYHPDLICLKL